MRSRPRALGLQAGDALVARVRGDGREYQLNLGPGGSPQRHVGRLPAGREKTRPVRAGSGVDQRPCRALRRPGSGHPAPVNCVLFVYGTNPGQTIC
ncbi:MAG: hypothetical protein NDJ94_05930 [Vicinamibacteria bacterium]|nr:hypothetical protein [Vicinamibacteria bacterium]